MDTEATISLISAIVAVAALIFTVFQNRKSWRVSVITTQRLEWAEHVRSALSELLFVGYHEKDKDLRPFCYAVLLYLTPENEHHQPVIKELEKIIQSNSFDEIDIDFFVNKCQVMLRYNWWIIKIESTVSAIEERWRDKKTKCRMSYYEKKESKNVRK